jgi:hypothetical protein
MFTCVNTLNGVCVFSQKRPYLMVGWTTLTVGVATAVAAQDPMVAIPIAPPLAPSKCAAMEARVARAKEVGDGDHHILPSSLNIISSILFTIVRLLDS